MIHNAIFKNNLEQKIAVIHLIEMGLKNVTNKNFKYTAREKFQIKKIIFN